MGPTLTVTAKGQITLRKEILAHLGVRPGERVEIDLLEGGRLELRPRRKQPATSVFGLLARPETEPLDVAAMNEIARAGWAGEG